MKLRREIHKNLNRRHRPNLRSLAPMEVKKLLEENKIN
jgi:hypothetical protein